MSTRSPSAARARFGCWTARWSPTPRTERRHECRERTTAAEGRPAGGECRAARPAAARRAVRARDRDRNGGDRGGPRVVLLLAGRAARGDRPARHEHVTVEAGRSFTGEEAKLSREAPARITHLD